MDIKYLYVNAVNVFGRWCMTKELSLGKNVSLLQSNIYLVQDYMQKTKRGFSKTLNIMLQEWDKYSLEIQKLRDRERSLRFDQQVADYRKAKPELGVNSGFIDDKNND
jgi:hypothetical protein